MSAITAAHGGGLVELDVMTLDGIQAVQQIVKLRDTGQQTGVVYIAQLTPRNRVSERDTHATHGELRTRGGEP